MSDDSPSLNRVLLENYKSIASCDVQLGLLTFLVGYNGSGKSNFLDALRFVAEALHTSLDAAMRTRGNVETLRHRGAAPDAAIKLAFELTLTDDRLGSYALHLVPLTSGGYAVAEEQCRVTYPRTGHAPTGFHVRHGRLIDGPVTGPEDTPAIAPDRLYLAASASPYDRPVFDALAGMAFYQPLPALMHPPHPHESGDLLLPDGSNCASVLLRLGQHHPDALERINQYLQAVLPDLRRVRGTFVGGYDTLEFYEGDGVSSGREQPFSAAAMSDGTLHALAILTALFQEGFGRTRAITLIGIEEPESALHPAATAVLRDAFAEAAGHSQVIATTQSADILDDKDVLSDWILAVERAGGSTRIGPLGEADRSIVRDRLYTVGELLRMSTLSPQSTQPETAPAHG